MEVAVATAEEVTVVGEEEDGVVVVVEGMDEVVGEVDTEVGEAAEGVRGGRVAMDDEDAYLRYRSVQSEAFGRRDRCVSTARGLDGLLEVVQYLQW